MNQRRPTWPSPFLGLILAGAASCGAVNFLRSDPSAPRDRASRFDRFVDELALDLRETAPLLDRVRLSAASSASPGAAAGTWEDERRIVARRTVAWSALQRIDGEFSADKLTGSRATTSRIVEADLRRVLGLTPEEEIDISPAAQRADATSVSPDPTRAIQRLAATPWSGTLVEAPSALLANHPKQTVDDLIAWERALFALSEEARFLGASPAALAATEDYAYPPFLLDLVLDDVVRLQSSVGAGGAQDPLFGPLLEAATELLGPDAKTITAPSSKRRALQRDLSLEFDRLVDGLQAIRARIADRPFNGTDAVRNGPTDAWVERMREAAGQNVAPSALADVGRAEIQRLHLALGEVLGLDPIAQDFDGLVRERFDQIRNRDLAPPGSAEPERTPATLWSSIEPLLDQLVVNPPPTWVKSRLARTFERPHGRWSPFVRGNLAPLNDPLSRPSVFLASRPRDPITPSWLREAEALRYGLPGRALLDAYRRAARLTTPTYLLQAERETFEEGWGLYAVTVAADAGWLLELDEGFGRLAQELIAFVALVADVGLNASGWTVAQAVDYVMESTPLPRSAASEVVARIVADPGRSALPGIGLLRLRTLRRSAEGLMGDDFSAAEFHAALLRSGPIPMSEMDARIEAWLVRRSTGARE
ncbi:hypothetical protein Poly30_49860 [Planctomycetes bacterium Poly30]|uniref:DUF885 domain-containing protein n=1 Tax=Saltatorellus ferox TaxID=2528018 RepID=A0A518EZD2_9BACT|nr:hypothetical protein Poly30_49860 [Planctomycetes bacterium Poly30]